MRHAYFKSAAPKPDRADPDRDDIGLIWFAPIAPMAGENVSALLAICRPLFERFEFDFYAALLVQNARSMILLTSIFSRKDDPRQTENAKALYEALGGGDEQRGLPDLSDGRRQHGKPRANRPGVHRIHAQAENGRLTRTLSSRLGNTAREAADPVRRRSSHACARCAPGSRSPGSSAPRAMADSSRDGPALGKGYLGTFRFPSTAIWTISPNRFARALSHGTPIYDVVVARSLRRGGPASHR